MFTITSPLLPLLHSLLFLLPFSGTIFLSLIPDLPEVVSGLFPAVTWVSGIFRFIAIVEFLLNFWYSYVQSLSFLLLQKKKLTLDSFETVLAWTGFRLCRHRFALRVGSFSLLGLEFSLGFQQFRKGHLFQI